MAPTATALCVALSGGCPAGLPASAALVGTLLAFAQVSGHRLLLSPSCRPAAALFATGDDAGTWAQAKRLPRFVARCAPRHVGGAAARAYCHSEPRNATAAARGYNPAVDASEVSPLCDAPHFVTRGESLSRCAPRSLEVSGMPLGTLNAQMLCGLCTHRRAWMRGPAPLPPADAPCHALVAVEASEVLFHYDYTDTAGLLRDKYLAAWETRDVGVRYAVDRLMESARVLREVTVAAHIPVAANSRRFNNGLHSDVFSGPSWFHWALDAVFGVVAADRCNVHVFTDGGAAHPHIGAILSSFPAANFTIHGPDETTDTQALASMVFADVTVAGASSFSRLGAVLGSNGVAMAPQMKRLPLLGLPNVVTVRDSRLWSRAHRPSHDDRLGRDWWWRDESEEAPPGSWSIVDRGQPLAIDCVNEGGPRACHARFRAEINAQLSRVLWNSTRYSALLAPAHTGDCRLEKDLAGSWSLLCDHRRRKRTR